jgi:long-subunit fatty acid transport protein
MFRRISVFLAAIACMVALFVTAAAADEYHYTNLLIGDRASGMGGAYAAVSDDATGLYYNPAGVAYVTGRSISASVNAFYTTEKQYKRVIGGNGWVRKSSSLLPNYFGVVQPVGRFKIGLSYAVPESLVENQDQTFHDLPLNAAIQPFNPGTTISSYIINFNNESSTYNFGPSIATELHDKISAGLTLYYYEREMLLILNQQIKTSAGGYEWTNDKFKTREWGIRPILGIMVAPVDGVSVGLALSKVLIQSSHTTKQHTYIRENLAVNSVPSEISLVEMPDGQSSFGERRKYPYQIKLGVAWFASQSLLLCGDIDHFTAIDSQNAEAVTNLALGAEYYLTRNWATRGGFFTNSANTPPIVSGGINQNEHIDLYGGTLSLSHFTRNTAVTLGAGYAFGEGETQIIAESTKIYDAVAEGWMFFLSSSFSH